MVRGVGFEPTNSERADLQSVVFDRFTNPAFYGAAFRTRTEDLLFTKQLLYQLS